MNDNAPSELISTKENTPTSIIPRTPASSSVSREAAPSLDSSNSQPPCYELIETSEI